uniref:Uncharacterized protein n=1 Tax=Anopheles farauti TaxID=69004 RepID=A0A182QPI3_9DIPT
MITFYHEQQQWRVAPCTTPPRTSGPGTVDLDDVLRHVDELVHQPLAVHLGEDAALVVVPERPSHRLVVHVRFVLVHAPQLRYRLRVDQLENALLPVRPFDVPRAVLAILQQLQQELPQLARWIAEVQHERQIVRAAGRYVVRTVLPVMSEPVHDSVRHEGGGCGGRRIRPTGDTVCRPTAPTVPMVAVVLLLSEVSVVMGGGGCGRCCRCRCMVRSEMGVLAHWSTGGWPLAPRPNEPEPAPLPADAPFDAPPAPEAPPAKWLAAAAAAAAAAADGYPFGEFIECSLIASIDAIVMQRERELSFSPAAYCTGRGFA